MKTIQVKAVKRENYGKKAAKAVRREGQIPAVLYGGGETVSFSYASFRTLSDGQHRDDGCHADDDTQHGEEAT
jgi:hypothetical protein